MSERLEKYARGIAILAGVILLALMLMVFADVLGRYFFHAPLPFSVEIVELGMGLLIFLGVVLTTVRNGHVSVDILSSAAGPALRKRLLRLSFLSTAAMFAVAAWQLFLKGVQFHGDDLTTQVLYLPVAPVVIAMSCGAAMTALVALYFAVFPPQQNRKD